MIVIHIGLRKSGSSTLQNFLTSNEPYLTAHHVLYPRCTRHHNNHHNIAHELLSMRLGEGFDMGEAKRRISSIEAQLEAALAKQEKLF